MAFGLITMTLMGHEVGDALSNQKLTTYDKTMNWIGIFHPILMHMPIALIYMTVLAEILYFFTKKSIYSCAGEFMIVCAAIFAVPTALTGLAFAYNSDFQGTPAMILWWHGVFGALTMVFAVLTAYIRECYWREGQSIGLYYSFLVILFVLVSITAFLGGEMAWGYPFMKLVGFDPSM